MVYEDIYDAKMAVEHLSGFNVANRYLIVLYYNPSRQTKKARPCGILGSQERCWHHRLVRCAGSQAAYKSSQSSA